MTHSFSGCFHLSLTESDQYRSFGAEADTDNDELTFPYSVINVHSDCRLLMKPSYCKSVFILVDQVNVTYLVLVFITNQASPKNKQTNKQKKPNSSGFGRLWRGDTQSHSNITLPHILPHITQETVHTHTHQETHTHCHRLTRSKLFETF